MDVSPPPVWVSPIKLAGDDTLRLNQVRFIGTHNSYHIARPDPVTTELNYTLPPLEEQLQAGVRQFELDLHYDREKKRIRVYHIPVIDEGTWCPYLEDCLQIFWEFSQSYPGHLPLFIFLEPKDELDRELWIGHLEELEATLRAFWPRERVFTPDDLRGSYPTIEEALREKGWPTLREVRGKVIFVLLDDGGHSHWLYTYGMRSLRGRYMFVTGEGHPYSAIVKVDNPVGNEARIQALLAQGLIIRTRADAEAGEAERNDYTRFQAALRSGAQIISTDYPLPHPQTGYQVRFPGNLPFTCHPSLAPPGCTPDWLEATSASLPE